MTQHSLRPNGLDTGKTFSGGAFLSQSRCAFALLLLLTIQFWPSSLHAAGEIATFTVVNDEGAQAPRIFSFGQMFRKGAVRPTSSLAVMLNEAGVPWQLNAKALYSDGSIRHGILAVSLPAMRGGSHLNGTISIAEAAGSPPPALPAQVPPDLQVTLTFNPGTDHAKVTRVTLPELAKDAAARREPPWLNGPLVREQRYLGPTTNGIETIFDVWSPASGPSQVDVAFHNDSSDNAEIDTQVYSVLITLAGKPVYHTEPIGHYAHSTWHKLIYVGGPPPPRIVPEIGLLKEVGAIPNYARITPDVREEQKFSPQTLDDGAPPLDAAGITMYMGTTGGRGDIGPLPLWTVFYLLDPSQQNQKVLTATADAAGSIPWHVRDAKTGGPISIDMHPEVWLDGRGKAVPGVMDRKFYVSDTKWTPDDAHQPSLTYLPYLLTGSQYYRDELAMQAGYVLLAVDPQYRGDGGGAGLVLGSQVRAVAWDLRTVANAAFILPSEDPQTRYFRDKLEANLRAINQRYISGHELDGAGELKGYLPGPYAVEGALPPWQNDYLVMVLGWISSMDVSSARPVLEWMTNFTAGRFTNAQHGYDPIYGTPYFLYVSEPRTGKLIDTWSYAFKRTFDPNKPVKSLDYPDWGGGYAALARAALASIITVTRSALAMSAYDFVLANTQSMNANYAKDPTFAIVPMAVQSPPAANNPAKTAR